MDIRHLRHFAAVAETLHFGRAADLLGMTQPPLSQSIKALETTLGAPLFYRTRRSVSLTPLGVGWLPHVQDTLARVDQLAEIAAQIREGHAGRLDLSFVSTADYNVLPQLVRQFRDLYPAVDLALTEATSDRQIAALAEGRGGAGIIIPPREDPLPHGFAYLRLMSEPLVAAVPESWIMSGRLHPRNDRLHPDDVVRSPLIVFPRRAAPAFHDLVTGYYIAHGAPPDIAQTAIQMQTIISLVSAGMGVALVPASLRQLARHGVRYLTLAGDAPQLETGLVWRQADTTPTLENFVAMARADQGGPLFKRAEPLR